ncbi:DUF222 domain-containing protein [Arthrobacter sp. JZ12]|uniref:HNH endonuclease signature motif containing protein n=1 Tax=Arthrobacter sp. JZ12 TaxID=2654190 RepID=UPI002B461DF0|nr:DUF222 domain-containing protein [Arthrobacter sp. JZ12]WRH25465.1 DUF222 domain-containing protein [Arthrobacter sp. JZ12]
MAQATATKDLRSDGAASLEPARIAVGSGARESDARGEASARCSCGRPYLCTGLFCPGPPRYCNGFELDSTTDEEERARVEAAEPETLMRMLATSNPWLQGLPDALDLLLAADRLESWVAAQKVALTAQVFRQVDGHEAGRTGEEHPPGTHPLAAEEIAPLLRVPGRTAHRMLRNSLRLADDLPATWEALEAGSITTAQARVIVEESSFIPAHAVPHFEETILETAAMLTPPKLARRCRRLREELHPDSIVERANRARKARDVTVQPDQDGMAWLSAYLPAEQAVGIFNRVDTAARSLQGPEEHRTLAQLRADVFTDVLTHTCTGNPEKGTGYRGIGASVYVTVPVMTLLGHRRQDWQHAKAENPDNAANRNGATTDDTPPSVEGCANGLLDGHGPIDPETARNLAAHAPSFTRILVHPETGAVLSVGRDRYRPPRHLQDWVRITNPTCVHPGCNRSAWSCELDHSQPWAHGGTTELANLAPRCKLHHTLKTDGIWTITPTRSGPPHTTSLAGKTYTTLPEPPPPF